MLPGRDLSALLQRLRHIPFPAAIMGATPVP
jgi:hypothetical protein